MDEQDKPTAEHRRPEGVDDATVEALGKLWEAVDLLREAGHAEVADRLRTELVGRNVVQGRWTFQIVEEYDDGYYATFKRLEAAARDDLVGGRRHLFEA